MGLFYFDKMQDDLAMYYFRKSSQIIPEYIPTYIYMAKIKLRHNNIKEAKQIIDDKLNKYPDNSELLELYSFILLKDGRIFDARYFAKKSLAKNLISLRASRDHGRNLPHKKQQYLRHLLLEISSGLFRHRTLMPIWRSLNYTKKVKTQKCLIRKSVSCLIYRVL